MQVLQALHSAAQAELFIEQAQAEDADHYAVAAAMVHGPRVGLALLENAGADPRIAAAAHDHGDAERTLHRVVIEGEVPFEAPYSD